MVPTKDLSEEIEKRQGIITVQVQPYEKIEVGGIRVDGPAIILINKD
ncbi:MULTISPECIES: BC1881 family protein [Bacillaceae]|uniref:BC1881 family protein n=2 Tax=Bacillati TaxID=1783272 RepID=A0A9W7QLP5_BACCE|nr:MULTISPECIES: BC1881 family protein [Bacillaceae]KAB2400753.1 BC1881 family protein [Bacillus cereus]KAB2410962.1 BC1881 family protein [Bacillus cereus]KAB2431087.1 BC1881 family protein [Bacillus cereus]MBG9642377.1 phage protein [Bacillus thuringiensis]MBG9642382.1 phage protein [Bacillus thuringiensis]